MTGPVESSPQEDPADAVKQASAKRRRLAEIFGDVVPETTRDERGGAEDGGRESRSREDWLKSQVPPHHG